MALSNVTNGSGVIQSLGAGSGLDIQSLVTQLVAAEGAPEQDRLTRKSADVASQISALGSLKGALSTFQAALAPLKDATIFNAVKATTEDPSIFTANANSSAVGGSYDVEVVQLASADKLLSKAYAGGATTVVGTGSLSVKLGATEMVLAIDSTNNTLAGIRDAINRASNNPGVQASLVYGSDGGHLAISSTLTGASSALRISSSGGDGGLAQLAYSGSATPNYTVNQSAADAIVKVSGIEVHSATNTVSGAIDGVDLTLASADPGKTYMLTVSSDQSTITANVSKFVAAYNALRAKISSLSSYDSASKVAGPMLGDALLNNIDSQLRRLSLNEVSGATGAYRSLAAVGITTDAGGKLNVDTTKLQAALAGKGTAVAQLFGASNGIAARLDGALTKMLASDGMVAARDKSLANDQKTLSTQSTEHNTRMAVVQQRYLTQFNALDTALAQMKQTSAYLTQQLASIAASTKITG